MSEATTAALTTLPRNASRGSLSSLVSFSYTAEKQHNSHHLVTAPCTRCGHAEPIRSLLCVVEKSLLRCPHCHTYPSLLLENHPGESPAAEDVLESLHRSLADLEATLRRHGAELERFSQMHPSPGSREPSLSSVATMASTADDKRAASAHPLVYDAEDLKQFTSGVTRLMRTLHGQVSRLEREEKALRAERNEVAKEREEIAKLKEELMEEERAAARGRMERSIDFSDDLRLDTTMSFATGDYSPSAENVWTEEKERELARLELQLLRANKNWSPEQENVLPMVERLREERRKAKKWLSRQGSLKISTPEPSAAPSPAKKRSSFSTFSIGRRDSKELRWAESRRGSAGDAGSGGGARLLRFFSGKKERE